MKPDLPFEPPRTIGKYEIGEFLGKGTSGVVFRSFDPFIERDVAIKMAKTETAAGKSPPKVGRKAFFAEARAAGKLHHPHIVSLFDAGAEGDFSYIVMEFVHGETLEPYGVDGERLPLDVVVDIIFKCCKALDYSHRQGVVHRDLKPTNIMLTPDRVAKIMDFSIAQMTLRSAARSKGTPVGTPSYMSPEQVLRREVGLTTDIYSLAVVMFELLTGRPLFEARNVSEMFEKVVRQAPPELAELRPDLPPELGAILGKALSKKPEERFQSGNEFASQLGRVFDRLRYADKQVVRGENRDLLRNLSFFNAFTNSEIDAILEASTLVRHRPGDTIIAEGDIDTAFYIIVKGTAAVRKGEASLDTLREGDCFGEIGFLLRTRRTATIVADSEVLLLKVNALLMEQVSPEVQLRYYKAFVETLVYRLAVTSARYTALKEQSGHPGLPD